MTNIFDEKDIRPKTLNKGQSQAISKDVNWLKKRKHEFVEVKCQL